MTEAARWNEVDSYVAERLMGDDADLQAALADSQRAGLPSIAVSAPQGKLLYLIALSIGARRILEVGTLGAYSTIWLARAIRTAALPTTDTRSANPPRLVTLELMETHARVARANLERAGVGDLVDIRVGPALETLPALAAEGLQPFDLIFIDADKENIPSYFDWAVELSRTGAVIITDNVVRDGALVDASSDDARVRGVRDFHEMLAARSDVESTTIQTVGAKGYDGFNLAVVAAAPAAPGSNPARS
jgi:predicted O-methyltransferase YrrM